MKNMGEIVKRFVNKFDFASRKSSEAEEGVLEMLMDVADGHTAQIVLLKCTFPVLPGISRHKSGPHLVLLKSWIRELTGHSAIPFNMGIGFTKDYKGYIITMSPSAGITPSVKPGREVVDLDDALDAAFEQTFKLDLSIFPIAAVA